MMTLAKGFAEVCCELCGNSTLMAFGLTIVDVIIKNISSRKMMSVIDDMLKCGDILFFLFSISYSPAFSTKSRMNDSILFVIPSTFVTRKL